MNKKFVFVGIYLLAICLSLSVYILNKNVICKMNEFDPIITKVII